MLKFLMLAILVSLPACAQHPKPNYNGPVGPSYCPIDQTIKMSIIWKLDGPFVKESSSFKVECAGVTCLYLENATVTIVVKDHNGDVVFSTDDDYCPAIY